MRIHGSGHDPYIIIIVVQRRAREIWLTQYSPGWTEQKEIEKPALRTLLTRWRAGQIQRPVFIKLDELNTHFEAMDPQKHLKRAALPKLVRANISRT